MHPGRERERQAEERERVGDADRHAEAQRVAEQEEREDVAENDEGRPGGVSTVARRSIVAVTSDAIAPPR